MANKVKEPFKARAKEWLRKQIVSLKRAPQRIALIFTVITSAVWLILLFDISRAVDASQAAPGIVGVSVFINTLLSVLVLPVFLNAFPKRKGTNYIFFALVFVFLAAIVLFDVLYYVNENGYIYDPNLGFKPEQLEKMPYLLASLSDVIVHIVFVGISAILLGTLPLYKKLIMKINTKKVLEESQLKEVIDTQD